MHCSHVLGGGKSYEERCLTLEQERATNEMSPSAGISSCVSRRLTATTGFRSPSFHLVLALSVGSTSICSTGCADAAQYVMARRQWKRSLAKEFRACACVSVKCGRSWIRTTITSIESCKYTPTKLWEAKRDTVTLTPVSLCLVNMTCYLCQRFHFTIWS